MRVENSTTSTLSQRHLTENIKLITTLDGGSRNRKEYAKQIQSAFKLDKRPMIQFFALLNDIKPYDRDDFSKLPEFKLIALMKEHPALCMEEYRFDVFPRDLLPPLHYLCALSASTNIIKACYQTCNVALSHNKSSLGSPTHYACMFNASLDVVQWLVKKNPDSLKLTNEDASMTPLHLACLYETDYETIAFLTHRCPEATKMVDMHGRTPLHWACCVEEPWLEIIEDLTEVNPDACLVRDEEKGATPLMYAIRVHAEPAILKDLIAASPDCAAIADEQGHSPLHRLLLTIPRHYCGDGMIGRSSSHSEASAASATDIIAVLKDLMLADKQCVKTVDPSTGNLPVHTAVAAGIVNIEVYKLLARKYSAGLEVTNRAGFTPHQLAKQVLGGSNHPEVVEFLNPFDDGK